MDYEVRPLLVSDLSACAAMASASSGRSITELEAAYAKTLREPDRGFLVGAFSGAEELLGFARSVFLDASDVASSKPVPVGWYLLGVNIAVPARRRGIAIALTRARVEWLAKRAHEAFYTVLPENHTSVELHRKFLFTYVGSSFAMKPDLTDLDLYRLDLRCSSA
jgi:aminoglycoside 6'-N-acetyltransferase I